MWRSSMPKLAKNLPNRTIHAVNEARERSLADGLWWRSREAADHPRSPDASCEHTWTAGQGLILSLARTGQCNPLKKAMMHREDRTAYPGHRHKQMRARMRSAV